MPPLLLMSTSDFRYTEIVHTIWHKTHFKVSWIYKIIFVSWIGGYIFGLFYTIVPNLVTINFSTNETRRNVCNATV